jgi:hypothetical protein
MTRKNIIQKWKDKHGRVITASFDTSIVRIKIEDKKVEELMTKASFFRKVEMGKWEQIA